MPPEPTTTEEAWLMASLRTMDEILTTMQIRRREWVYEHFVDFLLQHGRFYPPGRRPPGIDLGRPKCCFGNALVAAVLHQARYVEGFALLSLNGERPLALHHAWVTDEAAVGAYEVTTPFPWLAYFGMEFSVQRADDATWNGDASVIDDYRRGHPLLHQPWQGENPLAQWPDSPRLALLVAERAKRHRRSRHHTTRQGRGDTER